MQYPSINWLWLTILQRYVKLFRLEMICGTPR